MKNLILNLAETSSNKTGVVVEKLHIETNKLSLLSFFAVYR